MMQIREKAELFSHEPGMITMVPRTFFALQAFPGEWRFLDLLDQKETFLSWPIASPVRDFTLFTDWKKGRLTLFGKSENGFFRIKVRAIDEEKAIEIFLDKIPKNFGDFTEKQKIYLPCPYIGKQIRTALSFGNHKQHDWTLVKKRKDLLELLPFWYRIGALLPHLDQDEDGQSLLSSLKNKLTKKEISQGFLDLFHAAFDGIFVPKPVQGKALGYPLPCVSKGKSPLLLLKEGKKCIEEMIIKRKGDTLVFMSFLPKEFHCGRLVDLEIDEGTLFFEWSKGFPRRLFIKFHAPFQGTFLFPKEIKSFSIRRYLNAKKTKYGNGVPLSLKEKGWYFIDNFTK